MIGGFCGYSVGMAEVGYGSRRCGLLRLVMDLVEIGVGHDVVGYGLLRLVMGLVEIGVGHSIVGYGVTTPPHLCRYCLF